jgi:iron complex transport system ATP-binding protein
VIAPPVIAAHRVTVRAGRATLVDDVSLDVAGGEVVALLGPNGAGKSSLLAALAGDLALGRGSVHIHGRDVAREPAHQLAGLRAMLRQRSLLAAAFTALEVVQLGQLRADTSAARDALAAVELASFAQRSYPTLSGGEQQRVQLARVLAQVAGRRMAVLLDEPTAALDLRHGQLVARLTRRLARDGHAVVIVVHDLELAVQCADRVVVLAGGRVVADGEPGVLTAELLARAYELTAPHARQLASRLAPLTPPAGS